MPNDQAIAPWDDGIAPAVRALFQVIAKEWEPYIPRGGPDEEAARARVSDFLIETLTRFNEHREARIAHLELLLLEAHNCILHPAIFRP